MNVASFLLTLFVTTIYYVLDCSFFKKGKNSHIDIPTNQSKLSRERYGMLFLNIFMTY